MRILITADPELPVPPKFYGGIERVIYLLVEGLIRNGHRVTLIANKDSRTSAKLIAYKGKRSRSLIDILTNTSIVSLEAFKGYDIIHSFGRIIYLSLALPFGIPKIMSYQREPSISRIKRSVLFSQGSISFSGCSEYISKQIEPFARSRAIFNCINIHEYNYREIVSATAPLVFLGRVEYIKGVHNAIQIAQKAKRRLIIAGNIPDDSGSQKYFRDEVEPFLNDDISFIGPVDDRQKNKILGTSSCFLMPIEWNEPFGIVMAEALACGTPIIGYPRGAVKEVIQHGYNGFYAQNIEEAASYVEKISSKMRMNARRSAEERFSSEVIVNKYLEYYQELVKH